MNVTVQNGLLPQGFCPSDYQSLLNAFSAVQFVPINSVSSIVVSPTPPADHSVAWLQTDSNGNPIRIYVVASGAWLSPHPLQPGHTMIWNQTLPNLQTYDGGDASVAPFSDLSGQMWQLMATTLDGNGTQVAQAQFPVGVGTTVNSGAVVVGANNVTDTGVNGEDKHVLLDTELALHRHYLANTDFGNPIAGPFLSNSTQMNQGAGGGSNFLDYKLTGSANPATQGLSSIVGSNIAHNTLPPFYGVYFLQRTIRRFYVVPL